MDAHGENANDRVKMEPKKRGVARRIARETHTADRMAGAVRRKRGFGLVYFVKDPIKEGVRGVRGSSRHGGSRVEDLESKSTSEWQQQQQQVSVCVSSVVKSSAGMTIHGQCVSFPFASMG